MAMMNTAERLDEAEICDRCGGGSAVNPHRVETEDVEMVANLCAVCVPALLGDDGTVAVRSLSSTELSEADWCAFDGVMPKRMLVELPEGTANVLFCQDADDWSVASAHLLDGGVALEPTSALRDAIDAKIQQIHAENRRDP